MSNKRDIGTVIAFLRNEVIPTGEPVHAYLGRLQGSLRYRAPEQWQQGWFELCELLEDELGDPEGCAWKERAERIMTGKEEVPNEH